MDASKIVENLTTFYNCPKYSDITIRFGGNELKAHKLVLAQGSEYFRACFDRGFKESNSNTIELHGDDPLAVQGMISHLYGLSFDGRSKFTRKSDPHRPPAIVTLASESLEYLINLFSAAAKYLIPSLCEEAFKRFESQLWALAISKSFVERADKPARHIYLFRTDEAVRLRRPVVETFMVRLTFIRDERRFRQLLLDVPELALDLVQALAVARVKGGERRWKAVGCDGDGESDDEDEVIRVF